MIRFRILISGRVQGVAFRFTLKKLILSKYPHVRGFIRNLINGDVELVAELDSDDLTAIEKACWNAVPLARVDSVSVSQIEECAQELPHPFCVLPNK